MRLLHCAAAVAVPVIASTAQPVVHALPCCCRHRAMRESVQNGNLAAQNTAVQQLAAPPLAAAPLPLLQFGGVLRCAATVMATRRFVRCCRAMRARAPKPDAPADSTAEPAATTGTADADSVRCDTLAELSAEPAEWVQVHNSWHVQRSKTRATLSHKRCQIQHW